jgi:hypothetical protein
VTHPAHESLGAEARLRAVVVDEALSFFLFPFLSLFLFLIPVLQTL